MTIPRTGRTGGAGGSSGGIGTLVTKTLVISGEGGTVTTPVGPAWRDAARVRQGDGQRARRGVYAGAQTGSPMTYMLNGKQYIVVAVSSLTTAGELIAYALP